LGGVRNKGVKILALTKYGDAAASTRQRFLQYRPALEDAGFELEISPLLGNRHVQGIAKGRVANPLSVGSSYLRRLGLLLSGGQEADAFWVHCELFPYLPGPVERLAFRSGKPVIFDYDDAIFHMYDSMPFLRDKLGSLLAGSDAIVAGNHYLAEYARRWSPSVHVIPTVVDTGQYVPTAAQRNGPPVIGWIGSPSTWAYVRPILPVLKRLCASGHAKFLAVGGGIDAEFDKFPGMECRDWAEDREISDVQSMDIGIMPLPDEPWARGKCGYKLIQYMACGLPVVASPIGVNSSIVRNDESGLLATSTEEWRIALERLLENPVLRAMYGRNGRERAVADYSLESQAPHIVSLFENAIANQSAARQASIAER
jgi:glycosyltransferase involved in cell wall biosynthesis